MSDKTKKVNFHEGHRGRVRARIASDPELQTFAPHELLEFILFHTIPRRDTNELAHELIDRFGSFSGVFDASIEDLSSVKGMTENSAYLIKSILPISRAYSIDKQQNRAVLSKLSDVRSYYESYFINRNAESLYAIYLDVNLRVISVVNVGKNQSASAIELDVVKLQQTALAKKASHVILMHNHPGDNLFPSESDIITTNLAIVLLYALRVTIADHIIFGKNGRYFSFFQNNIIEILTDNCNKFLSFNFSQLYNGKKKLIYDNNGILFSESESRNLEKHIMSLLNASEEMKYDISKALDKARHSYNKSIKE